MAQNKIKANYSAYFWGPGMGLFAESFAGLALGPGDYAIAAR